MQEQETTISALQPESSGSALIYCRVSTIKQAGFGTSLESQAEACRRHAASLGYTVGAVLRETGSGAQLWGRPLLSQARRDIREKKYGAILIYALDRLSRDVAHLALILDGIKGAGCKLISVTESLEDMTIQGRLRLKEQAHGTEAEREKTRERCVRGKRKRALSGMVHNSGSELYGYRRNKLCGVREG